MLYVTVKMVDLMMMVDVMYLIATGLMFLQIRPCNCLK